MAFYAFVGRRKYTARSYGKRGVFRRQERSRLKIERLRKDLQRLLRQYRQQGMSIENLENANEEYRKSLQQRNSELRTLQAELRHFEEVHDFLLLELNDSRQIVSQCSLDHEAEVDELSKEIKQLQDDKKHQLVNTLSSKAYSTSVRELYYSLLTLKLPPSKIKDVVINVITHIMPGTNTENLRSLVHHTCVLMKCLL